MLVPNRRRTYSLTAPKALFVALNMLDVLLTFLLLRTESFYESNPVAEEILQRFGFAGMIVYKLTIMLGVLLIVNVIAIWKMNTSRRLLQVGSALMTCVVVYSSWLIGQHYGWIQL